eukprot:CAMPEP_0206319272 /NCGR_PEP_ID=MMETSP0106_2-20121207/17666_1 /ASSEMBLY_ACC=CAM_ASM_000206 /TAXON_ID=81532 /ORGANISM="Acanthoeca-like sp., Strain 10tr" /LENGTH=56 /DNA_ID=CAMNT_0053751091 /DNA_START=20 /DNA_END=191 /DNA_ORIENTATION=+
MTAGCGPTIGIPQDVPVPWVEGKRWPDKVKDGDVRDVATSLPRAMMPTSSSPTIVQ